MTTDTCILSNASKPQGLCPAHTSDMWYSTYFTQIKEPMVYVVGTPNNDASCAGIDLAFLTQNQPEGWVCAAARVVDNAGNVGISPPIRICADDGVDPETRLCHLQHDAPQLHRRLHATGPRRRADPASIGLHEGRESMALGATVHHLVITLSDVDRAVYEKLDLRIARHPSESGRYFWQRTLAYCLSYEEASRSVRELSESDEPPVSGVDPKPEFYWLGSTSTPPSADRLHRASKAHAA